MRFLNSLLILFTLTCHVILGQDYLGYGTGNFSGLSGVSANPAAASGSKIQLDVQAYGMDLIFNNSWMGIKREALGYPKLPDTWRNKTPNVPDNFFKNFVVKGKGGPYSALYQQRLQLPSVAYQIDQNNAIAFSCNMRQMVNVDGVGGQLANLFEKEFDLNALQNHVITNPRLTAIKATWMEYGLTFAHRFVISNTQTLRLGITPKITQGYESAYLQVKDLEFFLSTKDTSSYFDANVSLAHTQGGHAAVNFNGNIADHSQYRSNMQMGVDLGFMYEWNETSSSSSNSNSQKFSSSNTGNYKLKIGASLVDLGRIRYTKQQDYYDLKVAITQADVVSYLNIANKRGIDSALAVDFPANTASNQYNVILPTALNTQADYKVLNKFYLNLSTHIPLLSHSEKLNVHNFTVVSISPRFESYWFTAALPITYDALAAKRGSPMRLGLNVNAGPLTIGTGDLGFLFSKSPANLNFYAFLRLPLTSLKFEKLKSPVSSN
jgi:hypothetical protein